MKKFNVFAIDCNFKKIQLFSEIDESALNEFLDDYCNTDERDIDPWDKNYRWLKDYELPEYNIPYRGNGWIVRFVEV